MGQRCKGLQVKQLLIKFLAWWYGIFYILCKEPVLLCNKACCSLGVAKETNLLACFAIMGMPSSIKTDNGPACISRYFKQFLQSFSIKHITGIPYNPQAQGIIKRAHHTLKLQIKKFKRGEYTGTLLSSLSKADSTRFLHKMFSKPITIVNTTSYVLNFLNLPQGDILTRAEKHFEEWKDTSLPLPIWYQDGFNKQWKSGKLILQGKRYACISPDGSNELTWLPLQKI